MKVHFLSKINSALLAALLGLGAQVAFAATTTLTFDDIPEASNITTQYQALGVTVSGATTVSGINTPWPANSGTFVAYAPSGLMTFTLNSTITGNIQSVSAYVSSANASVGIYAYDAGGVLVGQAVTPGAANNNIFLTAVSSGNPIASVSIHDSGSNFIVDTLSFMTEPPVLSYTDIVEQLHSAVFALSASDFIKPSKVSKLKLDVTYFESLVAKNASNSKLLKQLLKIESEINKWVKPTTNKDNLLNLIDQLINLTEVGHHKNHHDDPETDS